MIDKKFLGIEIADSDDYGKILLRLALDLLASIRERAPEETIKEKVWNIVKVCCEPEFDTLIEEYDWDPAETDYAELVFVQCMNVAVLDLIELANRRIKHARKHERRTTLNVDDLRIAAIMAYVMTVKANVTDQLETTFMEEHGAMYFSR